jgi:hypothetical protein
MVPQEWKHRKRRILMNHPQSINPSLLLHHISACQCVVDPVVSVSGMLLFQWNYCQTHKNETMMIEVFLLFDFGWFEKGSPFEGSMNIIQQLSESEKLIQM